jgi:hypothetical protein
MGQPQSVDRAAHRNCGLSRVGSDTSFSAPPRVTVWIPVFMTMTRRNIDGDQRGDALTLIF